MECQHCRALLRDFRAIVAVSKTFGSMYGSPGERLVVRWVALLASLTHYPVGKRTITSDLSLRMLKRPRKYHVVRFDDEMLATKMTVRLLETVDRAMPLACAVLMGRRLDIAPRSTGESYTCQTPRSTRRAGGSRAPGRPGD